MKASSNPECNKTYSPVMVFLSDHLWIFLCLLCSVLLILSFPEPGIWLLAWVALVPLFYTIMTQKLSRVVFTSIISGVVFYTVYLLWLKEYKHPASLSGGVFLETVFFILAVLICRFIYFRSGILKAALMSCGWLACEYLKSTGYLGFPWGILGYTQYKNLVFIQTASIFGVWGVSFIVIYFNATLAQLLVEFKNRKNLFKSRINVAVVLGMCLISVIYGIVELSHSKNGDCRTKKVALIQANFNPWSPRVEENINTEIGLTLKALEQNPELVIWSESSVPFPYEYYLEKGNKYALKVHRFASRIDRPFIFGSLEFTGEAAGGEFQGDFYNVAVYYNNGSLQGIYRKIHLVPFGEWFPYEKWFPFVKRILEEAGAGDFTPGSEYVVFHDYKDAFSVLICFEDVFGNLARKFVLHGSELLINITNDAWTGSSAAEKQHYSISVFRAVENRRPLVRAANGGVTACITPLGRTTDRLELFKPGFLVCDVPLVQQSSLTFYTRTGDILAYAALLAAGVFLMYGMGKKIIDLLKK